MMCLILQFILNKDVAPWIKCWDPLNPNVTETQGAKGVEQKNLYIFYQMFFEIKKK